MDAGPEPVSEPREAAAAHSQAAVVVLKAVSATGVTLAVLSLLA